MSEIKSRPYNPDKCCEACCFGRGGHASWCEKNRPMVTARGSTLLVPRGYAMTSFGVPLRTGCVDPFGYLLTNPSWKF